MGALAAVLAGTGAVYATVVEPRWFRVRREILPGALRPGTRTPLTVLHVSDLHLSGPSARLERFLGDLTGREIDLVVATGDLLGGPGTERSASRLLNTLTADGTPGVAVLGSHDVYAPRPKSPHRYVTDPHARSYGPPLETHLLRRGLRDGGWRVLEDDKTILKTAAGLVEVAGLRDPHLRLPLPDAGRLEPTEPAAALRLGLVHAPYQDPLRLLVAAGYRTVLSGHTHGGQVRVPGLGALVTNCDLATDRARGTSPLAGGDWLHVSAGLGQSRYAPFRFACRPEASVLKLLP